jgi:hypothetical protein
MPPASPLADLVARCRDLGQHLITLFEAVALPNSGVCLRRVGSTRRAAVDPTLYRWSVPLSLILVSLVASC